jgi:cysteine-rich repeat protein
MPTYTTGLEARLLSVLLATASCYSPNEPILVDDAGEDQSTTADSGDPDTASTGMTSVESSGVASDEGSLTTGDGGTSVSDTTAGGGVCGDGHLDAEEVCDDGVNDGAYGGCSPGCSSRGPHCGDGRTQYEESCDDGNDANADGCNIDCVVSGTLIWSRTFETGTATSVAVDEFDSVAVGQFDGTISTYGYDGSVGWSSMYAYPNGTATSVSAVAYSPFDAVWVVGGSANVVGQESNAWWRKLDAAGLPLMTTTYDSVLHDGVQAASIVADSNGDFYVVGSTQSGDLPDDSYIWVRKYDADGALLWAQTIDQPLDDVGRGVALDDAGNLYVAGSVEISGALRYWWLRKLDSEGSTLWTKSGGESSSDAAMAVATGPGGVVAVCGSVADDVWVRLYSPGGVEVWTNTYDGPAADPGPLAEIAYDVAIDSSGAVLVAGGYAEETAGLVLCLITRHIGSAFAVA